MSSLNLPKFSSTNQYKYDVRVEIGLENTPEVFNLKSRILGTSEDNLRFIADDTGARMSLRGQGSGSSRDPDKPLHIYIEHHDIEGLQKAKLLATSLVNTVQEEYRRFVPQLSLKKQNFVSTDVGQVSFGVEPSVPSSSQHKGGYWMKPIDEYKRDFRPERKDDYNRNYRPEPKNDYDRNYRPEPRKDYERNYRPEPKNDYERNYRPELRKDCEKNYRPERKDNHERNYRPEPKEIFKRDYRSQSDEINETNYRLKDKQNSTLVYRQNDSRPTYKPDDKIDFDNDYKLNKEQYQKKGLKPDQELSSGESNRLSASTLINNQSLNVPAGPSKSTSDSVTLGKRVYPYTSEHDDSDVEFISDYRSAKDYSKMSMDEQIKHLTESFCDRNIDAQQVKRSRWEDDISVQSSERDNVIQKDLICGQGSIIPAVLTSRFSGRPNTEQTPLTTHSTMPEQETSGSLQNPALGLAVGLESPVFKWKTVIYNNKSIRVYSFPDDGESLYTSCAHWLFGPFRSIQELNSVAKKLHQRAVDYIRNNKEEFLTDLTNLYEELVPNHGLKPELAFEHCCLHLRKPGHSAVKLTSIAIAALFSRPILILHESGNVPSKISPLYPPNTSEDPIIIFRYNTPNNHFVPVDEMIKLPEFADLLRKPKSLPVPQITKQNLESKMIIPGDFVVATWFIRDLSLVGVGDAIDKALATNYVMFACLQGGPSRYRLRYNYTTNYIWFYSDNTRVVFLVHKDCPGKLTNFCTPSSNLATALFCYKDIEFLMIGCFLPPPIKDSSQSYSEYERIRRDLTVVINKTDNLTDVFLFGQFNAQIGSKDITLPEKEYIGLHLLHEESNTNGHFLKKLAISNRFRVITSLPCNPAPSPATFKGVDPHSRNKSKKKVKLQISHLLVRSDKVEFIHSYRWWLPISSHAITASKFIIS